MSIFKNVTKGTWSISPLVLVFVFLLLLSQFVIGCSTTLSYITYRMTVVPRIEAVHLEVLQLEKKMLQYQTNKP